MDVEHSQLAPALQQIARRRSRFLDPSSGLVETLTQKYFDYLYCAIYYDIKRAVILKISVGVHIMTALASRSGQRLVSATLSESVNADVREIKFTGLKTFRSKFD